MRIGFLTAGLVAFGVSSLCLAEPLVFTGTAVDADTGKPVPCVIRRGVQFDSGQWRLVPVGADVDSKDGAFTVECIGKDPIFDSEKSMRFLRFDADGYAAVSTESKLPTDGRIELTVKVKKSPKLRGVVLDPDGKPAANARVIVGTESLKADADIPSPASAVTPNLYQVYGITVADGTFALPAQSEDRVELVALNEAGLGFSVAAKPGEPTTIRLQRYGSISGKVAFGDADADVEQAQLQVLKSKSQSDAPKHVSVGTTVRYGRDGSFSLPRVPPGYLVIYLWTRERNFVDVTLGDFKAGEVVNDLNLPRGTTSLDGSVRVPTAGKVDYRAQLMRICNPLALPDNWNDLSVRDKWWNSAAKTPEVKAVLETFGQRPIYTPDVEINADGSFKLTGMDDGFWSIDVNAWWKDDNGKNCRGSRTFHFAVKDGKPNVDRIEPLPLKVEQSAMLTPGTAMPTVEGVYPDGRKFEWADVKGKVALVEIWGPWCGPCKADMPGLKQLRDRYKGRADFTLFSFSIDDDPAKPWAYKTEHGFDWPDVYLGSHEVGRPKANALGVDGYPTYLLVGRDGKFIDVVYLGNAIDAIDRDLAKK
jgi:thiol-disulfide isomerase/thioredoxin